MQAIKTIIFIFPMNLHTETDRKYRKSSAILVCVNEIENLSLKFEVLM